MRNSYETIPFPDHNINPELKDGKWIMQAAKSAWGQASSYPIFYGARDLYTEYRSYGMGKQSVDKYKPFFGVDETSDASSLNISWENRPVVSKFRDVGIARIAQKDRNIICTPIDALAQSQADEYFKKMRIKILMKNALEKVNPELAQLPQFQPEKGEPENLEELEMQIEYGFKFNLAMESEMAISLAHYQNNLPQKRMQTIKDLWDIGVGGYKDYLTNEGQASFRDCDPANVVMSYCRKPDFSDKLYCGEVVEMPLSELSQYFKEDEMEILKGAAANKQSMTTKDFSNRLDKMKVQVLEIEIKSWNELSYERYDNSRGNPVYKKAKYEDAKDPEKADLMVSVRGELKSRYFVKKVECWYTINWIIGTDLYYNEGKVWKQKNPKEDLSSSESSYHFQAVNFHNMQAQGMMERLKPIIDEYQLTIFKVQDFKNKWLPYIMEIDFDAIENISYGKSNADWTPEKVLDMVFQNRALIKRGKDIAGYNVNGKAVEIHSTGMAAELMPLMQDLSRLLQEMRDVTGLNESTDASGTPERKGKFTSQMDQQATNNALYPIMFSDKMLFESLSRGCLLRQIQAVKMGKVEGIGIALGSNTVKFIQVTPDICKHAWSIKVEDRLTDEDINVILEQMGLAQQSGLLEPEDIFLVKNMDNLKQVEQTISYRVKKRKEQKMMEADMNLKKQAEYNAQGGIAIEQEKQKTLQMEYQLKQQLAMVEGQIQEKLLAMKLQIEARNTDVKEAARVHVGERTAEAKVETAHLAHNEGVVKTDLAGQYGLEKQKEANKKPPSSSK